jgi:hypothetical protein
VNYLHTRHRNNINFNKEDLWKHGNTKNKRHPLPKYNDSSGE